MILYSSIEVLRILLKKSLFLAILVLVANNNKGVLMSEAKKQSMILGEGLLDGNKVSMIQMIQWGPNVEVLVVYNNENHDIAAQWVKLGTLNQVVWFVN